jgi:hypothetical protein
MCASETLAKNTPHAAGGTSQVQDRCGFNDKWLESGYDAIARHGMDEIRIIEGGGSPVETASNISQSRHWRTVPRFF